MSLFSHPILGEWIIDDSDERAIAKYGKTSIDFRSDGSIIYTIHGEDVDQKILLSFQIQGNVIISDQPSSPKTARTEFTFGDDGRLALFFDGLPSFYRRHEEKL